MNEVDVAPSASGGNEDYESRCRELDRQRQAQRKALGGSPLLYRKAGTNAPWRLMSKSGQRRIFRASSPARSAPRAPRRARPAAPKPTTRVDSDDGPAGPPLLVDQRSAGPLLGWSRRRYLEFLKRRSVPHVVDARLHIARVDDVLAALGLPPRQPVQAPQEPTAWDERAFLRVLDGGRKAGAR
jgi:hypothetical protein